jgi:hypothetical protein
VKKIREKSALHSKLRGLELLYLLCISSSFFFATGYVQETTVSWIVSLKILANASLKVSKTEVQIWNCSVIKAI